MTINLEKALIKANKKILTDKELLIVREYEQNAGIVDDDALLRVGLNRNIKGGQLLTKDRQKAKDETLKFKQERVFHISQIEKICKDYYLRFLPSVHYVGSIDKELPFKINNFEAAYGVKCQCDNSRITTGSFWITIDLRGQQHVHTDSTEPAPIQNTFIMAPASSFKLEQRPKDPLFFYKINEEYYYLIHKWGNDLNVFRRFKGFLSDSKSCFVALLSLSLFSGVLCISAASHWVTLALGGLNFGFALVHSYRYFIDKADMSLIKNKWDSQYID